MSEFEAFYGVPFIRCALIKSKDSKTK